jgi:hypothetical protein
VKDLVAEAIIMFSAFATIVVMVLIIVKERRKQKKVDAERAKNRAKRRQRSEPGRLYLD